jgi:predicted AAA+ superfamily ATPase
MIRRLVTPALKARLAAYPAVALVGPRQVGKTTLAKSLAAEYFDLEQEADRLKLDVRWQDVVKTKGLVVLDEAQAWPEVFPRLRGEIDRARKRKGRFLLLGSVSPALMTQVSESLAGRLSIVELTPFSLGELKSKNVDDVWLKGGYPDGGVLDSGFPRWQRDYLDLLAMRDLPAWGLDAKPQVTSRLIRMVAAVHGRRWNASAIGQSLGLSYHTVNSYMDYLAGAFLVRRLDAYRPNLKKRLVKRPKYYWRDSGLLHSILMTETMDDLLAQPWVAASWEGFVIAQVLDTLSALGRTFEPYYFLTSDGYEVDLVLDLGKTVVAVEVKLTASPATDDMAHLRRTGEMVRADEVYLVSRTPETVEFPGGASCDLPWLLAKLSK